MNWAEILIIILVSILGIIIILSFYINIFMKLKTRKKIININEKIIKADAIMVLGCRVRKNGYPGIVLKQRLDKAIELYNHGWSDRILVTGNHATDYYDEANLKKDNLVPRFFSFP